MRRLMSVSILALSLAMATPANADDWFRLNMSPTIFFGTGGETGGPPDGGVNNNIDINIDAEVNGRVYGTVNVPVAVSGIDATYTVSVTNLPSGATWNADSQVHGAGTIQWSSASQGTYHPTIEVRGADGALVATSDLEIIVHAQFAAAVSQPAYEVEVGGELNIVPSSGNAIGSVQWGSTPSELPEWLSLDAATGTIDVDTASTNTLPEIVLTAVDQGDLASASTVPFSISVNGAPTDYWATTLGGASTDQGQAMAMASDGSIYVAGTTSSTGVGGSDVLLVKYDAAGTLLWQRTLGGTNTDDAKSIGIASDGSVYVAGYTNSIGSSLPSVLLIKYNSSGAVQWQRTFSGSGKDEGYAVTVALDGSVYVGGNTDSSGSGVNDILLIKYDSYGNLLWQKTLGGSSYDFASSITNIGGFVYLTGYTGSAGAGSSDAVVAKYNSAGTLQWQRVLGGSTAEAGQAVSGGPDGSVYVTGYTSSAGAVGTEILLAKYSSSGVLQWQRTLGGNGADAAQGVTVGTDGSVYVIGYTNSAGSQDFLLAKFDADGTLLSQKVLGGSGIEMGHGINIATNGSVYVAGRSTSAGAAGNDILLARLPADGGGDMTADAFSFQDASLVVGTPTLTSGAASLSGGTPNLSSATSLLSGRAPTLTSTTTPFVRN
jgi:uncharacterized delta-60 repeat protein